MNERRFFNPSQPQTLQIAVLLLYLNAVLDLLFGFGFLGLFGLLIIVGMAAGGFGIANEQKWGYVLAVTVAIARVALLLVLAGVEVLEFPLILTLLFDGALVALLVHPESRDYQRIWFK
ncbi:MAG: hypothetical protein L0206_09840 [Actinobacteria bacterium]|nr:hypothetical protein [Actinomycetota bacterium]